MYKNLNLLKQLMQSKNNENFFIVTKSQEKANLIQAIAMIENKQIVRWNMEQNDAYFNPLYGTEEELLYMVECIKELNEEEKSALTMAIKVAKRVKKEICIKDIFYIISNTHNIGQQDYVFGLKRKTGFSREMQDENDILVEWFLNDYYAGIGNPKNCTSTYSDLKNLRIKLNNFVFMSQLTKVMDNNTTNEPEIKVNQTMTNLVQIVVLSDEGYLKKYSKLVSKAIKMQFELNGEKIPFTYVISDEKFETFPNLISESYMEQILKTQKEILEQKKKPVSIDLNEEFGEKIRRKREGMGISRDEMAVIMDISPNFLGDVERGRKSLSTQKMFAVCNVLNISLDGIIKNTDTDDIQNRINELKKKKEIQVPQNKKPVLPSPINPIPVIVRDDDY